MRTTLTLEDDVVALLERERKRRNATLKDIVNEALREGLTRLQAPATRKKRFRTAAVSLGACKLGSLDDVAEALALAEGDGFQ